MKSLLLSALLLLTITVSGQENKLSIGITGSPDFYKYQFKSIPGFAHEYKTKTGYSFGLSMNYNFVEKFSVKTGLLFSTKGYILDYSWVPAEPNDPLIPRESDITLSFLDIPVLAAYDFVYSDKLSIYASAGIVAGILINEKEISTMGDGTEKETDFSGTLYNQDFNKVLVAINIEPGLKYNLSEKFFVSVAPYLRYGLNKISDQVLESNPWSYGASVGFYVNF
jgi:hypothetical protein